MQNRHCPRREAVLTDLGHAVATLPFDKVSVQQALEKVHEPGAQELVIEVCCTVAAFEAITRVADATVRAKLPAAMINVLKGINKIAFHSRENMLAGSAFAVMSIAVLIAMKRA